jgi:hypothetical protein
MRKSKNKMITIFQDYISISWHIGLIAGDKVDIIRDEIKSKQYLKIILIPDDSDYGYYLRAGGGHKNTHVYCKDLIYNIFGKIGTFRRFDNILIDRDKMILYVEIPKIEIEIKGKPSRDRKKKDLVLSKNK